jgi:hypothetical protein
MTSFQVLRKIWVLVRLSIENDAIKNCLSFILEAKIRFLKARLRVMQEELERMHTECVKRVSLIFMFNSFQFNLFFRKKKMNV